jgi:predicted SprT family Zn-dependent metalloprotease
MHKPHLDDLAVIYASQVAEWSELWNVAGLEHRLHISWSDRMRRSLGRCIPSGSIVRVSSRLALEQRELVLEVLCHEVAHVAAYEINSKPFRPHGKEWADLMRAAGFEPRTSVRLPLACTEARSLFQRGRFLHRCPVCGSARVARTSSARWRCTTCLEAGLSGELEITPLPGGQSQP